MVWNLTRHFFLSNKLCSEPSREEAQTLDLFQRLLLSFLGAAVSAEDVKIPHCFCLSTRRMLQPSSSGKKWLVGKIFSLLRAKLEGVIWILKIGKLTWLTSENGVHRLPCLQNFDTGGRSSNRGLQRRGRFEVSDWHHSFTERLVVYSSWPNFILLKQWEFACLVKEQLGCPGMDVSSPCAVIWLSDLDKNLILLLCSVWI